MLQQLIYFLQWIFLQKNNNIENCTPLSFMTYTHKSTQNNNPLILVNVTTLPENLKTHYNFYASKKVS